MTSRPHTPTSIGWLKGLALPTEWAESKVKYVAPGMQAGTTITAASIEQTGTFPVYGGNGLRGFAEEKTHEGTRILIGRQGALCGNVHLVSGEFWASEHAIVARPIDTVDPCWLAHLLQVMNLGQYSQTAAQPGIGTGQINPLPIPVPPLDEQRAIAEYLDRETARIDTLIEEQQRLIEMLRERRRAIVNLALAGIDADHAALRYFARLVSGSGFPVEAQGQAGLELPFFKVKDLKSADVSGVLHPAEDTISRETAANLRATVIPEGSLVFAKVGAALMLGRVAALPMAGCIDNNMSALIFGPKFDPEFARFMMLTFDFTRFVQPGAVPSLNTDGLREFRVPPIPVHQQRAIAAHLNEQTSKIDTMIFEAERFVELSRERRSALITAAVTGQIDVREVA